MTEPSAALRMLRPGSAGVPLVLVGEEKFAALTTLLTADFPVHGLRIAASGREAQATDVAGLAMHGLTALRAVQPQGPYRLIGYSFGGLIAYEMACQLVRDGQAVRLLGLLDTPNPRFHQQLSAEEARSVRAMYLADRRRKYLQTLRSGRLDRLGADALRFLARRLRPFTAALTAALARRGGGAATAALDIHTLWHAYAPGNYGGDMLLIRAEGRDGEFGSDATMGWQRCVSGAIRVEYSRGLHEDMLQPPCVASLAARLDPWLAATGGGNDA